MGFDIENPYSVNAGVDLSGSQYCAVDLDTNGALALPTAGGSAIGILYTAPLSGKAGTVWGPGSGIRKAKYGGTVTVKDKLKLDASGRFVTASASDIAAGSALAIAFESGVLNQIGSVLFFGAAGSVALSGGIDDIVLGTTAPSNLTETTYVQTTGTKTGVLANGVAIGQKKDIIQSVAASTPIGTITGTFKTLAGAAATTLALGTAVAQIVGLVWDGTAWRARGNLGGTGSSLA